MSRSRRLVSVVFISAGTLHFLRPGMYEQIMPAYLPAHRELVLLSGAAEIAGGVGAAVPATRRASGIGLALMLAAIFPANVNMALKAERFRKIPPALLWARLPLQALLVLWVLRATRRES